MTIKNLQIFIRWAEKHEIDFEYSPYDAIDFNELTAIEVTDAPNEKSFILPCLMADFSNLESLELNWLGLNQLPAWVENCKRLESLSLMGNEIETIPSWIENLSKLKKLDCRSNDLYSLPTSSTSLLELDASFNGLESFDSWEGNFPNLIKLNCSRTRMKEIPNSLLNLESLEKFILEDSPNLSECSKELKHKIDLQLEERKKIRDREKKAYLDAFRGNSLNTYRRYLKEYPEGRYSEEARVKIEENSMKNFRKNVRDYYKAYYENGDEAHLIDHADGVCDLALKINNDLDEKLIILASYLHDMFNATNRPTHNKLAYEYVLKAEDKFLAKLSKDEVFMVAHAVFEHRASFKGEFYSRLSALISSADRGLPDLEATVIRSMKFNKANAEDVYDHIKDKYGSNGYAKYPDVYREIFKDELETFQKLADEITVERVLEIWKYREV